MIGAAFLPPEHGECANVLKTRAAPVGLDITVSTLPPIVDGLYATDPLVCPHGVTHWFEPTGEQIAYWIENKIP